MGNVPGGASPREGEDEMVKRSALVVGIAVAGVLALASTAGASAEVSCGDTITTDTTLDHNLVNCPNNGIVIGADDITLD